VAVLCETWGFSEPQKILLLGYGVVLLVGEVLMLAVNPIIESTACSAYNAEHGSTAMSISIGWLQNSSRFIFMAIQLLQVIGDPKPRFGLMGRGSILLAASLVLGVLPCLAFFPNTLTEVCSTVEPPMGAINLMADAVWTFALFSATICLTLYGFVCPRCPASLDAAQSLDPEASESQAPGAPLSRKSSIAAWTGGLPGGVMNSLVAFANLRFFVQFVNSYRVFLGSHVMGAFAQMLVMESFLEHGQLIFLLLTLIADPGFAANVALWMQPPKSSRKTARHETKLMIFSEEAFPLAVGEQLRGSYSETSDDSDAVSGLESNSNESDGESTNPTEEGCSQPTPQPATFRES